MAKDLPYFCWFPADAETDENFKAMTDEEVGFYLRCLNHTWLNKSLPADPEERARVLNRPQKKADKMWQRVGRCFIPKPDDPSRLVNPRQEKAREEARNKSKKARASADARWMRLEENLDANDMRSHCEGNARASDSDSSSGKTKKTISLPFGWSLDEQWAEFRSFGEYFCWIEADFREAWDLWKVLDFEQKCAAIGGLRARKDAGVDVNFIPRPKAYLQRREWQRPIRSPTPFNRPLTREEKIEQAIRDA